MAKGRMLKTRISKSKKMGRLNNDSARLLFLMILPHTDVKGRFEADPILVRNICMPYFKDWDDAKIQQGLESLDEVGLILLYDCGEDQYLQMIRFDDFQTIRKDRESESEIPDPPKIQPESNQNPALSKVKLSKDKLKQQHPSDALCGKVVENSEECNSLCDQVYKKGLNIYALLGRFKKQSKLIHPIPEAVIMEVCKSYLQNDGKVRKEFPYFVRVLTEKSRDWFAGQNVAEHEKIKKQPMSIKDILAVAMGEC